MPSLVQVIGSSPGVSFAGNIPTQRGLYFYPAIASSTSSEKRVFTDRPTRAKVRTGMTRGSLLLRGPRVGHGKTDEKVYAKEIPNVDH